MSSGVKKKKKRETADTNDPHEFLLQENWMESVDVILASVSLLESSL